MFSVNAEYFFCSIRYNQNNLEISLYCSFLASNYEDVKNMFIWMPSHAAVRGLKVPFMNISFVKQMILMQEYYYSWALSLSTPLKNRSMVHTKDMWIAVGRAEINCTSYQYDSTFAGLAIWEFVVTVFIFQERKAYAMVPDVFILFSMRFILLALIMNILICNLSKTLLRKVLLVWICTFLKESKSIKDYSKFTSFGSLAFMDRLP